MLKSFLQKTSLCRVYAYYRGMKNVIMNFCNKNYHDRTDAQKKWIEKDMTHWYLKKGISPAQYWEQSFDMIDSLNKDNFG